MVIKFCNDNVRHRFYFQSEWMNEFGNMVYGTRSMVVPPQKWGVTTHKGKRMFLHIMNPEGTAITIPYVGNRLIGKGTV